jgi:5'(3')-deoxyribonucleotidase
MTRLHIGLDMDGVKVQLLQRWLEDLRQIPGVPADLSVEDIVTWNMTKSPKLAHMTTSEILDILYRPFWYTGLDPIPGARENIEKIVAAGHRVTVITATVGLDPVKDAHVEECKREWLRRHMPALDGAEILFKHAHQKVDHVFDVIVEDHPDTLVGYAKSHPRALVLGIEYPYNRHIPHIRPDGKRNKRDYEEMLNHSDGYHARDLLSPPPLNLCGPRDVRLATGWNDTTAAWASIANEIAVEAAWQ